MNSLKCPRCGLVNFATATACKRCDEPLDASAPRPAVNAIGNYGTSGAAVNAPALPRPAGGLYYKPSGEVTVVGALAGLIGGLAAGAVLAFAYSYLVYYIPIIYLNLLCVAGFAALLGFAPGYLMHVCKVRNTAAGVGIAIIPVLASFYLSWAVWVSIIVSNDEASISALALAAQPLLLWELIAKINEVGAWTLFKSSTPVSGLALWVVWAIEAGVVLIGAPVAASMMLGNRPFCENCNAWCAGEQGVALLGAADDDEVKRRVEAKDFQYVRGLGTKAEGDVEWYRVDLHGCPTCGQMNTLSVMKEKLKVDDKGNVSVDSSPFIENLLLTAPEANDLRTLNREAAAPAPSAPAFA